MVSGSGSNIKLLDYFASGAPTVTTITGARGFPIESGCHALVVAPEELAHAIRSVFDDPHLQLAMPIAARSLAEAHSWTALGIQFKENVDRLLASSDAGPDRSERSSAAQVSR
jgi:hypothetical protein